jgi:ribonuclease HII
MRIGVDEAGKGPVLGSMFAAAVRADPADLPTDVADSKTLTADARETLAAEIRDVAAAVAVSEIPVGRIDDPETDMNTLTVDAHAAALAEVVGPDDPVTVDAAETDEARFERRLAARLGTEPDIDARHRADESEPLVGAASIVAKVERDVHVDRLADVYGDVGSGYPSDETTRTFLARYVRDHGCLPDCARTSWQTADDVLAAAEQADLTAFI